MNTTANGDQSTMYCYCRGSMCNTAPKDSPSYHTDAMAVIFVFNAMKYLRSIDWSFYQLKKTNFHSKRNRLISRIFLYGVNKLIASGTVWHSYNAKENDDHCIYFDITISMTHTITFCTKFNFSNYYSINL